MAANRIKQQVLLQKVYFDKNVYPRTNSDWRTVYDYKESMKAGAVFPPITLAQYKGKLYLVDGKHRFEAFKSLKQKSIPSIINMGWSLKQIYSEAVKSNIGHGRQFSPYEKRLIIMKLREMQFKDGQISQMVNIPIGKLQPFVGGRLVSAFDGQRVTEEVVLKSGLKHYQGQTLGVEEVARLEGTQVGYNMMSQVDLLEQVVDLLEKQLVDMENPRVARLVKDVKALIKKY